MDEKEDEIIVRPIFRALGILVIMLGLGIFFFEVITGNLQTKEIIDFSSWAAFYDSLTGMATTISMIVLVGTSCLLGRVPNWIMKVLPKTFINALKLNFKEQSNK